MKMNRTHCGLMFGLVPVYLDMSNEDEPVVEARNWFCEILLDIITPVFGACIHLRTMTDMDYEPSFPIKITGEL